MKLDDKTKEEMKKQKLEELSRQHFSVEMNYIALKSTGNEEEAQKMKDIMEGLKKAYEAVEGI